MKMKLLERYVGPLAAALLWIPMIACGSPEGDPARARLVLLSPGNGEVFTAPSATLRFRVEDAEASGYSVRVGDAPAARVDAALAVDEEISTPLALEEGVNEVEVVLHDAEGDAASETLILVVNPPPLVRPGLVRTAPENGVTVDEASVTLSFHVLATSALGYRVEVGDDAPIEVAQAIAVGETVSRTLALSAGVNTITLSVLDAAGVADTDTFVVLVDLAPAPEVVIDEPAADSFVYDEASTVSGRILTRHASTASVTQNGAAARELTLTETAEGYAFSFEAALERGENALVVTATSELGGRGSASVTITRDVDTQAPSIELVFPRDTHAVRTRRVLVRGRAEDADRVSAVWLEQAGEVIAAELDEGGGFRAWLELAPASNDYTIHARDRSGNESSLARSVYFGQQLGAGGSNGGLIRGGQIYTWGRNNLGQSGLGYVSHESRTTWCERTLGTPSFEASVCKATTLTSLNALCDDSLGAGTTGATACRASVAAERDAVCVAAGAGAPTSCATSASANLSSACDAAYGAGTPAGDACKVRLVCASTYASGTAERDLCESIVLSVPSTFPASPPPYAATLVTRYSTAASPPATTATSVAFGSLGVGFVSLAFNQNAASALDDAGDVWGWGDGASGMLCLGDTDKRSIPHRVAPFGAAGTRVIAIARGYDHLLMLRSDGTVWGCGSNSVGQIGDGTSGAANNRLLPAQVQGLPANISQVIASSASSYALTTDGLVYAWGRNQYANLGQGTTSTSTEAQATPLLVPGLTDVVMLAVGRDHVLAARADGSVWAWGLNASKQVGDLPSPVASPIAVDAITSAFAVYANGNQSFYEDAGGRLLGWGQNGSGNLGIPENADQPVPSAPVFGLSEVTDVSIGALHGFVLRGDVVFSWGWSFHGSLGAGSSAIHTWAYRTPILLQFAP